MALSDRSSESRKSSDASRVMYSLSDYISVDEPTSYTNPRGASIHIRLKCKAKELTGIK